MNTLFRAACIATLLAGPLAAQDTTETTESTQADAPTAEATEATEETEATAPTEAPTDDAASQEQPADPNQRPGETIVSVHKDWQIRCLTDNTSCYMYQLAVDSRDAPVAEMRVVSLNQENDVVAGFTIMTPLRTFLPAGVQVQIDNGRVQRYQFELCTDLGCITRFGVSEGGLGQFRAGNKVRVTVVSAENVEAPVILDVSLLGFTAAVKELAELN